MLKPFSGFFLDPYRQKRPFSRRAAPACLFFAAFAIFHVFSITACKSGFGKARAVSTRSAFVLRPEKTALPVSLPYRGFNLLGKFSKDWNDSGFAEEDFSLMSELGFNFARLPVDYRTYVREDDWLRLKEDELKEIDDAVAWGQRYGVHVDLNLHRAPGFCINPPAEKRNLWKDADAQDAFIAHWEFFARRYALISPEHLSFNLVNDAIRKIDPDRPVTSDGIGGGRVPVPELIGTDVVQSYHDYAPFSVTHYKAEWVGGAEFWPVPSWPITPLSPYLYGPEKGALKTPLIIRGNFRAGTRVVIRIGQVSHRSRVKASFDGETAFDRSFIPGPDAGEWKTPLYSEEWKIYQNLYDLDCEFTAAHDGQELRIWNEEGDWCTFTRLSFIFPGSTETRLDISPTMDDWGLPQASYSLSPAGLLLETSPPGWKRALKPFAPWRDYIASGGRAFVGEMGVYKFTPHDVALRWLEDQLKEIHGMGLGWALWNFSGPFGPFDSQRADVIFEDFRGRKLDREMLELLKRY
jgi:aryl-phospho-beta-D-glucosidase BglC (GH1 family)